MFTNVIVGLKEGVPHEPLLDLVAKATGPGARVHVVTYVTVDTGRDDVPSRLERAEAHVASVAQQLDGEQLEVTSTVSVIATSAGGELVDLAEERGADLLVVGLAKRTRVGKALVGSDAQRILLNADCAVLSTRIPSA